MKSLAGTTANVYANPLGGKFAGHAEIVIITSEPSYQSNGGSGFVKVLVPEQFRFHASLPGVAALIESLTGLLDEMNKIEKQLEGVKFMTDHEEKTGDDDQ